MNEPINYSEMESGLLEAELLVELGKIESLKAFSIRRSGEFWKAVENRNRIQREQQIRRKNAEK